MDEVEQTGEKNEKKDIRISQKDYICCVFINKLIVYVYLSHLILDQAARVIL